MCNEFREVRTDVPLAPVPLSRLTFRARSFNSSVGLLDLYFEPSLSLVAHGSVSRGVGAV